MSFVRSWGEFEKIVRNTKTLLLAELDRFDRPILVAGCQRSGTTILTRVITQSDGVAKYKYTHDDELDAALILSGAVNHQINNYLRYCFQTTYLNNSYKEYFLHKNFKLIWVLRNPVSVVNSMLNNWKRSALNRLFKHCGADLLDENEKKYYNRYGAWCFSNLRKACLSYNSKITQLNEIMHFIGKERLLVVEYDQLVLNKTQILPCIYDFIGLEYNPTYTNSINNASVAKQKQLSKRKRDFVRLTCEPGYLDALKFVSSSISHVKLGA